MSDEEDEYEYEYDDDDDGGDNMDEEEDGNRFEYTDDEEDQDDSAVALENAYYNAKGIRDVDTKQAANAFEQVILQEQNEIESKTGKAGQYGPWSYKAMKQLVKLHIRAATSFTSNNDRESSSSSTLLEILKNYKRLLECVAVGDVSPAAVEKGISGMLDRVARTYSNNTSLDFAMDDDENMANYTESHVDNEKLTSQTLALAVYDATLKVFHPINGPCKNERLWFKTNLKYGQLLYELNETAKLQQILKDLLAIHNGGESLSGDQRFNANTSAGVNNSTNSMEIYALQIQLYSRQKDHKKLRETYQKAMNVMGGIPHPRTLALIHELGAKMHMASREYENASKTFFYAFKSYDEAGDISRLRCLKYLVLASMLHASTINPFDSQEARSYKDDPEIVAMTELVSAFHNNDITKFEKILKRNSKQLLGDPFIREHVEDLLHTIRTQVLKRVIRPYTRISLSAIASELNDIPVSDVEKLLVRVILDGVLDGKIDRVNNILIKQPETMGVGVSVAPNLSAPTKDSFSTQTSSSSHVSLNVSKSDIILQCEAMDSMITLLEGLSNKATDTRPFLQDTTSRLSSSINSGMRFV